MRPATILTSVVFLTLLSRPVSAAFGDITLIGQLPLATPGQVSEVWGYYDSNTGKEYALVGDWVDPKVWIIDVSDPTTPVVVSTVGVPGFDMKTWGNYMYVCDGWFLGLPSRIVDISDPTFPTILPEIMPQAHNITIAPTGFMYFSFWGLQVYDLNTTPATPDSTFGTMAFFGHDVTVVGDRMYAFTGDDLQFYDVTTPGTPALDNTITLGTVQYYHSGDTDTSGTYLYMTDELSVGADPDVYYLDVTNVLAPIPLGSFGDNDATVHNIYTVGDIAFVSWYTAGFKTMDIRNPASPVIADTYDTSAFSGDGYEHGAWGVYPYAPSGYIYVSDMDNGLFVFGVEGHSGTLTNAPTPSANTRVTLSQNAPNPFNPTTRIDYHLDKAASISLIVYDVRGKRVATLVDGPVDAGPHSINWNGVDQNGLSVPSGVYYYRLDVGPTAMTKKMVLLK